ncbi:TetR/AcrR family transcriptional regulator [Hyphomonas sp. NPDC076900]|uniref:TetR/AcrR family transcriptional regulator n=1 Tax=unclassified Hyphomonas TaxID=2630699 RepID=UPI003D04258C
MSTESAIPERIVHRKSGYHHGDLRNSIIEAVAILIDERRSLDFQLKDVARMVGTSQPAIYKHFENKQDLLIETAVAGYGYQAAFRDWAMEQAGEALLAKLLGVGYAYVHFAQSCPGFYILMKNLETDEILSSRRYQKQRLKGISVARALVRGCVEDGTFIAVDIDDAMASLQATVAGLAQLYLSNSLHYVARAKENDTELLVRLFSLHVGSLLSAKGRRQMAIANRNPFSTPFKLENA